MRALARTLRGAGEDVVILYGERLVAGPRGAHAARALLSLAERSGLRRPRRRGPARACPRPPTAAACPRRACCPTPAPGFAGRGRRPRRRRRSPPAAAAASSTALLPAARRPAERPARARAGGRAALERATTVIAHADFLTDGVREHADRRLPGRGLRREGRHAHAPRRARAAPAPGDRPPRRGARRVVGHRRARPGAWASISASSPGRWRPPSSSPPCPSTPG